jgi:hypothetical protein
MRLADWYKYLFPLILLSKLLLSEYNIHFGVQFAVSIAVMRQRYQVGILCTLATASITVPMKRDTYDREREAESRASAACWCSKFSLIALEGSELLGVGSGRASDG